MAVGAKRWVQEVPSHVVLATDFTARCDRAQDRAVQLAIQWNASLTAVHALSDMTLTADTSARHAYRRAAMRKAAALGEELGCVDDLRSSVTVEEGPVDTVVLDVAKRERGNVIVTGIARAGPLAQVLVGSTVTALARKSSVPLLVVKKKVADTNKRVFVATDLSESSVPALLVGLRWFSFRRLGLFHAFQPPYRGLANNRADYDRQFGTTALVRSRDFLRAAVGEDAAAKFDIVAQGGDPVLGLETLANNADTDLVITGTHGRTGLLHAVLGSIATRLLDAVPCDVLVVPSGSQ
jgi:nucleotide-binding universal stress UspA family protein